MSGKKVALLALEDNRNFVKDKFEWKGRKNTFEIVKKVNKTEIRFVH